MPARTWACVALRPLPSVAAGPSLLLLLHHPLPPAGLLQACRLARRSLKALVHLRRGGARSQGWRGAQHGAAAAPAQAPGQAQAAAERTADPAKRSHVLEVPAPTWRCTSSSSDCARSMARICSRHRSSKLVRDGAPARSSKRQGVSAPPARQQRVRRPSGGSCGAHPPRRAARRWPALSRAPSAPASAIAMMTPQRRGLGVAGRAWERPF